MASRSDAASVAESLNDELMSQPDIPKGQCQSCGYRLHANDKHRKCYQCLGGLHDIDRCSHCQKLSKTAIYRRRRAQDLFLTKGTWPSTLEFSAAKESSTAGSFRTAAGDPQSPKVVSERGHPDDASSSQWEEPHADVLTITSDVEEEVEEEGGPSVEIAPPTSKEEERRDFEAFMASREQATPSMQPPLQSRKRALESVPDNPLPPKQPRYDLTKDQHFVSLRSDMDHMTSKLDQILSKLSGATAPAPVPIPRFRPALVAEPPSYDVEEGDREDAESVDPWATSSCLGDTTAGGSTWNLSRQAARNIWVTGLDDVCPDVPLVSSGPVPKKSSHYRLLKQKKDEALMPFLPEVSQQCLEASLVEAQPPLRHIEKFYRTSVSEEKQLLNIRHVPKCLACAKMFSCSGA